MKGSKVPSKLYLIDAMALAYRAHFIFINRPLINSKGQNTSATYGFTSALLKLIEDHEIEYMAVVFDAFDGEGTFRDELYEDYKAQRDPTPEDLIDNIPLIKSVVEAMDIPVVEISGVEADDVIGTIATEGDEAGAEVVIVSPDKDFQQLLTDKVSMFRPAYRGESFDPVTRESFVEKFGVQPRQFIDILALMGDASDNVPGVPGIGEKTAMKLVAEYGSVEAIIERAEDLSGKRAREGMLNHADDARLSKELVTIKCDLDLDLSWEDLHRKNADLDELKELFDELEFRTLFSRMKKIAGPVPRATDRGQPDLFSESASTQSTSSIDRDTVTYRTARDETEVNEFLDAGRNSEIVSVKVFSSHSDYMVADPIGMAVSFEPGNALYIPLTGASSIPLKSIASSLTSALETAGVRVGHNIKKDLILLKRSSITLDGPFFDTMIADYLLSPDQAHSLPVVARKYLDLVIVREDDLLGSGRNRSSILDIPRSEVSSYGCEQVDVVGRLVQVMRESLEKNDLAAVASEIEFPLIEVLADVEQAGITVDTEVLDRISTDMASDLEKVEAEIYEASGEKFNIGSPAQLGEILFDKLQLPVISKTSTGKASTKETVLTELATEHELPALVLDWRQLSKLKNTYVDVLPELINPETGRIHTEFNQTVAATGRLSSQNPNLQNIPIRTERGRSIRKAFIPAKGMKLLSADYVQIELRILASMSDDPGLIAAFEAGEDVHTATAARVFGIPLDEVTRAQRSRAKEVNYGIPYGISAFGLAIRLRCPRSEAQQLIDQYHSSFPSVARFLNEQIEKARSLGYAETLLGRKRYIPAINARNRNERAAAERIAVNMPIQGSQADMIKIAMLRIHEQMEDMELKSQLLLQVHDELVFEVAPGEEEVLSECVVNQMKDALPLRVPIEIDINIASNWLDAH
ncbi:MAG: DNA polymerase I [Rhodothermales bacterium]|nr:DNA polymerase I [Rhodothermales bacterium]